MSLSPLSSASTWRASPGISGAPRSSPRIMTGSVEARAAPRIAANVGVRPSNVHAATAMTLAVRSVPGPRTRRIRFRLRRTSAKLTPTASVKSTSTRPSVAMVRRICDCSSKCTSPSPSGPRMRPKRRKRATCGNRVRSTRPESNAATRMTTPISARVVVSMKSVTPGQRPGVSRLRSYLIGRFSSSISSSTGSCPPPGPHPFFPG